MKREALISSNLHSFGYDPEKKIMEVQFRNGNIFQYNDVSQETVDAFKTSQSKGKFFYANIAKAFKYKKVTDL